MTITVKDIIAATDGITSIQKSLFPDKEISCVIDRVWTLGEYRYVFKMAYNFVKDIETLAKLCDHTNTYITSTSIDNNTYWGTLLESHILISFNIPSHKCVINTHPLCKASLLAKDRNVKYFDPFSHPQFLYYRGRFETDTPFKEKYAGWPMAANIISTPLQLDNVNGKSIRMLIIDPSVHNASGAGALFYTVTTNNPMFNYLDKGHTVYFYAGNEFKRNIFVTNQVNVHSSLFSHLFSFAPDKMKQFLKDGVFLNAADTYKMAALIPKAEMLLPANQRKVYLAMKAEITEDYAAKLGDIQVTKFRNGEIPALTINNIKCTQTSATYSTISLEAPDLAKNIISQVYGNDQADIYTLIGLKANEVVGEIKQTMMNEAGTGHCEDKKWEFSINKMPITVSLSTKNTRRKVNNHYINDAEIVRVLNRAACFYEADKYDKFLAEVERYSLKAHDVVSGGLPVKVFVFDDNDYYRAVSKKHPKLKFVKEGCHYYLLLNDTGTEKVRLHRFIGFINAVDNLNKTCNNGRYWDENNNYTRRNTDWMATKLKALIREHTAITSKEGVVTYLDTDKLNGIITLLLSEREKAAKKSEALLASVLETTGSTKAEYKDVDGYVVKGTKRTYFVEEATNKVWNYETGAYVCIVDGKGEMGVGFDALVARILALKNDDVVAKHINTL